MTYFITDSEKAKAQSYQKKLYDYFYTIINYVILDCTSIKVFVQPAKNIVCVFCVTFQ